MSRHGLNPPPSGGRARQEIGPDPSLAFGEIQWRHWDLMFTGGLRAAAFASRLAAPMMIQAGRGLIANITWVLDRPYGVACVAVSPGWMRLERMNLTPAEAKMTESAEFAGRAIAALAADDEILAKSGQVLNTPALAREYGFTDVDGTQQSAFWDEHLAGTRG